MKMQRTWIYILGFVSILAGCELLGESDSSPEEKNFTVSFSVGDGGGTAPANLKVPEGSLVVLYSQGAMEAPAGKEFSGWKIGDRTWILNNNTPLWSIARSADLSINYAVTAPHAQRVIIPVDLNTPYDYVLYFLREIKYDGRTVALVEFTDPSLANTAFVRGSAPYTTTITLATIPTYSMKPALMLKNNSNKSIRVFYASRQMTNGTTSSDFVVVGGESQLLTGFEVGDNISRIEFNALAWKENLKVPVDMVMEESHVYEITVPVSENAAEITVEAVPAEKYYD